MLWRADCAAPGGFEVNIAVFELFILFLLLERGE